ncbi:MAG: phosphate ABC transporter permease subunit PstC [Blastopirellula sp.]|nr:phosphate ABC transporter permease subunit PstC [Blastopirellula sp.]
MTSVPNSDRKSEPPGEGAGGSRLRSRTSLLVTDFAVKTGLVLCGVFSILVTVSIISVLFVETTRFFGFAVQAVTIDDGRAPLFLRYDSKDGVASITPALSPDLSASELQASLRQIPDLNRVSVKQVKESFHVKFVGAGHPALLQCPTVYLLPRPSQALVLRFVREQRVGDLSGDFTADALQAALRQHAGLDGVRVTETAGSLVLTSDEPFDLSSSEDAVAIEVGTADEVTSAELSFPAKPPRTFSLTWSTEYEVEVDSSTSGEQLQKQLRQYPGFGSVSVARQGDAFAIALSSRENHLRLLSPETQGIQVASTSVVRDAIGLREFFGDTRWSFLMGDEKHFGIWPLICGTMLVTVVAMVLALPLGLVTAVYLSEYAPRRVRAVLKPTLEVLAGIPTVVYGFFALVVITPMLQSVISGVSGFNALAAGIAVGILCLPTVCSLSEDALQAVPRALREGAYGLGATKFDVSVRVVVPAALSGIISAFLLAIARAVGETMIVALAAGSLPIMTADPRHEIQTMTGFMVQMVSGDVSNFGVEYSSMYAVAATLFILTMLLTLLGQQVRKRFREAYE